jgi:hypothetical protein
VVHFKFFRYHEEQEEREDKTKKPRFRVPETGHSLFTFRYPFPNQALHNENGTQNQDDCNMGYFQHIELK